ncbi:hypothetical protein CL657_01690 [bacterium]|nr:hypothetical protein [bacterium]
MQEHRGKEDKAVAKALEADGTEIWTEDAEEALLAEKALMRIREKVGAHLNNLKRVLGDDAELMTDPEELLGIFYSSLEETLDEPMTMARFIHTLESVRIEIDEALDTDPEIAWCGLTETDAKEQGIAIETSKFSWAASGRALSLGRTDGLTKLILEKDTQRILGMGIVGPGASELIAEGCLAISNGLYAADLAETVHAHPTLSETIMESAELFFGHSAHAYNPKVEQNISV